MSSKPGLTLLECLIYLAVSTFLLSLIITNAVPFFKQVQHTLATLTLQVRLYSALEHCARDIMHATSIKKLSSALLVITDNNGHDIGWLFKNDQLIRVTGTYNMTLQQWTNKHSACIANGIVSGQFSWAKASSAAMITCTLQNKYYYAQRYIAVRARYALDTPKLSIPK